MRHRFNVGDVVQVPLPGTLPGVHFPAEIVEVTDERILLDVEGLDILRIHYIGEE